ncbi:MAG: alkaline phosphatase family protein [Chloroflexota bacterium]
MAQSIAQQLESRIRQHRLLDFPVTWADELIFPYYDGLSLPNIAHSIASALGYPMAHHTPLLDDVWQGDVPQAKRVVTFLMDGMGYKHLNMLMAEDAELRDAIAELNGGREIVPLTSVAPSTTAVALTSTWTGVSPATTGMTGTVMFLRELSLMADMLSFRPITGHHLPGSVGFWGMPPEKIVTAKNLNQHLSEQGIATHTITNKSYVGNGLSRILHQGVQNIVTHLAKDDFLPQVESVLKNTQGTHSHVSIYWSAVDTLAHHYGAHHDYTNAEIRRKILALRDLVREPYFADGETLLLLFADHGHYDSTQPVMVAHDDTVRTAMTMSLAGDERHAYLYVSPSSIPTIKDYIQENYAETLTAIESEIALQLGYFGDNPHEALLSRIGNLILIPRLGHILSDPVKGTLPMISRHAGLSDWEMLVPFIWRLS